MTIYLFDHLQGHFQQCRIYTTWAAIGVPGSPMDLSIKASIIGSTSSAPVLLLEELLIKLANCLPRPTALGSRPGLTPCDIGGFLPAGKV
jgi:hypothetical protein